MRQVIFLDYQVVTDGRKRRVTTPLCSKAKLIEQHIKLKGQLKELASKMDEIVEKERDRKKKKQATGQMEED
jgi:hypothetical protein